MNVALARANVERIAKVAALVLAAKTREQLRARLWGACQRLFNGGRDANFTATFVRSIDVELTKAWNEGAEDVGFSPEDMTREDQKYLSDLIDAENEFIDGMVNDIDAARVAKLEPDKFESQFGARCDMWANRYTDVTNQAKLYFGGKNLLEWVLGPTEKHCQHNEKPGGWGCANLSGIVATAAEWEAAGVKPQGDMLSCNGFNCQCSLQPTDKKRTRGGIPKP